MTAPKTRPPRPAAPSPRQATPPLILGETQLSSLRPGLDGCGNCVAVRHPPPPRHARAGPPSATEDRGRATGLLFPGLLRFWDVRCAWNAGLEGARPEHRDAQQPGNRLRCTSSLTWDPRLRAPHRSSGYPPKRNHSHKTVCRPNQTPSPGRQTRLSMCPQPGGFINIRLFS